MSDTHESLATGDVPSSHVPWDVISYSWHSWTWNVECVMTIFLSPFITSLLSQFSHVYVVKFNFFPHWISYQRRFDIYVFHICFLYNSIVNFISISSLNENRNIPEWNENKLMRWFWWRCLDNYEKHEWNYKFFSHTKLRLGMRAGKYNFFISPQTAKNLIKYYPNITMTL